MTASYAVRVMRGCAGVSPLAHPEIIRSKAVLFILSGGQRAAHAKIADTWRPAGGTEPTIQAG